MNSANLYRQQYCATTCLWNTNELLHTIVSNQQWVNFTNAVYALQDHKYSKDIPAKEKKRKDDSTGSNISDDNTDISLSSDLMK